MIFLLSRWSGGLVHRYGAKLPLTVGPVIAAIGYVLFTVPDIGGSYWTTFFPAMAVLGLGMAISVAPLSTTVMSAVEARRAGIASGINNAVARTAGLLAIAVMGIFILSAFTSNLNSRLAELEMQPETQQMLDKERIKLAAAEVPAGVRPELNAKIEQAIAESFVAGFRLIMLIAAGLALAGGITGLLMIESKVAESQVNSRRRT